MKLLISGLAASLSILATNAQAELMLDVDGEKYTLSALMENCQNLADDPVAQIACFSSVSKLVEEQADTTPKVVVSVSESLDALRTVAQYQTEETGLLIGGNECDVQILYYANYFHISRRNVSSIDLYSAIFDASKVQVDELTEIQGGQAPLFRGKLDEGATATVRGGVALESAQYGFAAKPARTSIGEYAVEVANQLAVQQGQSFDFVLVHPAKNDARAVILDAFETYVGACRQ